MFNKIIKLFRKLHRKKGECAPTDLEKYFYDIYRDLSLNRVKYTCSECGKSVIFPKYNENRSVDIGVYDFEVVEFDRLIKMIFVPWYNEDNIDTPETMIRFCLSEMKRHSFVFYCQGCNKDKRLYFYFLQPNPFNEKEYKKLIFQCSFCGYRYVRFLTDNTMEPRHGYCPECFKENWIGRVI